MVSLHLDGNRLSGEIPPQLGNLQNLERLYLGYNQLSGCLPVGLRDIEGTRFETLGLPSCKVSPDRAALIALYNATDGPNWWDKANWHSNAPIWEWEGVTVNDEDLVTELDLTRIT